MVDWANWAYMWTSVTLPVPVTSSEDLLKIKSAADYKQEYTFWTYWGKRKLYTIVHSSDDLELSLTQTFIWTLDETDSKYRVSSIIYS